MAVFLEGREGDTHQSPFIQRTTVSHTLRMQTLRNNFPAYGVRISHWRMDSAGDVRMGSSNF